jgi:hypothetical protein
MNEDLMKMLSQIILILAYEKWPTSISLIEFISVFKPNFKKKIDLLKFKIEFSID